MKKIFNSRNDTILHHLRHEYLFTFFKYRFTKIPAYNLIKRNVPMNG